MNRTNENSSGGGAGPAVRTWRERMGVSTDFPLSMPSSVERAMEEEIAELRANAPHAAIEQADLRATFEQTEAGQNLSRAWGFGLDSNEYANPYVQHRWVGFQRGAATNLAEPAVGSALVAKAEQSEPTMLWDANDPEDGTHGDSPKDFAENYACNAGNGEYEVEVLCAYRGGKRTMRIVASDDSPVSWSWASAAPTESTAAPAGPK
jgi:hypothetical protein